MYIKVVSLTTDYYIDQQQKAQAFDQRALTNYLPILRLIRAHLLVAKDTKSMENVQDVIEMIDEELLND